MRRAIKHRAVLCAALTVLTACDGHSAHDHEHHSSADANIIISDARVRPPLPGQKIAAGYFQLKSDKADRLVAVTSPVSGRIELHIHIDDNGIMRMRPVKGGIDIPAGKDVIFEPGGFHIMFFDAAIAADAQDIALTFDFERAPDVTIIADIMSGAKPHGSDSHGSDSHGSDGHGSDSHDSGDKSHGSGK